MSIPAVAPLDPLLALHAETLTDLEKTRIALDNRVRSLEALGVTEEGQAKMGALAEAVQKIELQTINELERTMKKHSLGNWIAGQKGLGFKQTSRLLAVLGSMDRFPTVSKLWAYCGMHVVDGKAPRHTKGQQSNWNEQARMRIRLISESCIKCRTSPYRPVYDAGRLKYADLEITDGHKHNRALRLVSKAILKDLWLQGHNG